MMTDFINQYGMTILYTILTAVFSYVGIRIKQLYEERVKDKETRAVIRTAVKAAEQMYKDLSGAEKLDKACEGASEMLATRGITVSGMELRLLIEECVSEIKDPFKQVEE